MKQIKTLDQIKPVPLRHSLLLSYLTDFKNPNDKIKQLLREKAITRVKRGLYLLGDGREVSKELLANHLYGPSYISMDYALSYHGLIPERVYEVTSVSIKMAKSYHTPLGRFSYTKANKLIYPIGIVSIKHREKTAFLIASEEKALCDKILYTPNLHITSQKGMLAYLIDDLRIELNDVQNLGGSVVKACMRHSIKSKQLGFLDKIIDKLQKGVL